MCTMYDADGCRHVIDARRLSNTSLRRLKMAALASFLLAGFPKALQNQGSSKVVKERLGLKATASAACFSRF